MDIPEEAREAAATALAEKARIRGQLYPKAESRDFAEHRRYLADVVLEAAAPLVVAAELERIVESKTRRGVDGKAYARDWITTEELAARAAELRGGES